MKKVIFFSVLVFSAVAATAQSAEVSYDAEGHKVVRGFMTQQELVRDTAFAWFAQNQKGYTPAPNALQAFRAHKDSINIIAFGGTWCGDTQNLLPKFFALTDAAGFPQDRVTLLGVDHSKKTIEHLAEAFGVVNVPTFIVMKNGKEIGRVVEYGSYGLFDKELGEIISGSSKK